MAVTVGAYTHEREQPLTRCLGLVRYTDIHTVSEDIFVKGTYENLKVCDPHITPIRW